MLFPFCVSKSQKAKRRRKKKRKEEQKVPIRPKSLTLTLSYPPSHMLEWAQHLSHCERQALTKLFKQNITKLINNTQLEIKIDRSIYAHFKSLLSSFLPQESMPTMCFIHGQTPLTPLIIFSLSTNLLTTSIYIHIFFKTLSK